MAQAIKVVTDKVRFSYANVFVPKAQMEGGTPKYSVSIIIPKSDTETVAKINKAIEQVKADNQDIFKGVAAKLIKGGLRDGDEEKSNDPAYANSYFINANSSQKPGLVDADRQPIIDASEIYSGCYGRASVSFFPYNVSGSRGVGCGLNGLQKLEDGEALGGVSNAAADFAI